MQRQTLTLAAARPLTADVCELRFMGDTSAIQRPGQFVNLALTGLFLRRPISVCDWEDGALTLILKVVGKGTRRLAALRPGETLDALVGLGNGYDVAACPDDVTLAGGGVGVPPLYGLAKALLAAGKRPTVALGFNTAAEAFYVDQFRVLGLPVTVATVDGSLGVKGFVTDAMAPGGYACCCGPEPMLKAVHRITSGGQFSFEARMGCGFGACMGCSCQTIAGPKRICKEGPVLRREEILW